MVVSAGPTRQASGVSAATAKRVWAAVAELGYLAHPAARSLAGGRVGLVGVYTFEQTFPIESHDFYLPFLIGIEEAAQQAGDDLVLFTSATGQDGRRGIFRGGVNRLAVADGCVLLGQPRDRGDLQRLARTDFPVVSVGRREVQGADISWVGGDYAEASAALYSYLTELGHRHIACIALREDQESTLDRIEGYQKACREHGQEPDRLLRLRNATTSVAEDLQTVLKAGATAVLAQNVELASEVVEACTMMGLDVPKDVSVAVLGDPPRPDSSQRWTGFRIPRRDMGYRAMEILTQVVRGEVETPKREMLACELEFGATATRA